ncbi:PEP-CTERM sorting domain-containing protein [Paraglaciecola polaris]|uniref:PEP motif-containing protein n=1 Tax=Paraglaciecola polaris LMG 21857 TaxID=1129793 RepID=K6YIN9_9ALTE|nr:PEP-CTERM sorting domain-containing protein [Paraglaciecola polaris]GAC32604.1 PEP motif-containing protein [Paraglaciecola polaris LMG 21857]|tara:strand:- start:1650 stop:2201 length:552 start_codon:yes stop_codon:yes gene_type:complete
MKKVLLLVCAMFVGSANANMINIDLSDPNPSVGDTVSVNINMTGITEDFTAFFTGFLFDSSLFEYVDGSVSSDFPLYDPFTGSGLDVDSSSSGLLSLNLFEDFVAPVIYGAGDYLVASFNLLAISEGQSSFSLAQTSLFAPDFGPETALDTSASGASIAVPAPGSMALMGLAGLALFGLRRKA